MSRKVIFQRQVHTVRLEQIGSVTAAVNLRGTLEFGTIYLCSSPAVFSLCPPPGWELLITCNEPADASWTKNKLPLKRTVQKGIWLEDQPINGPQRSSYKTRQRDSLSCLKLRYPIYTWHISESRSWIGQENTSNFNPIQSLFFPSFYIGCKVLLL